MEDYCNIKKLLSTPVDDEKLKYMKLRFDTIFDKVKVPEMNRSGSNESSIYQFIVPKHILNFI
jgi:hypothetical protein